MALNKTLIEWVKNPDGTPGYTWNPITGCLNHVNGMCKGGNFPCYAHRLGNGRLKSLYLANRNLPFPMMGDELLKTYNDPFYPRFWPLRLEELPVLKTYQGRFSSVVKNALYEKQRKGIFVCDMSDLFGIGVPNEWTRRVLELIEAADMHRFYLLTKQPQNLAKFSPFPDNCYVGVTATNQEGLIDAMMELAKVIAKVKYISFEPLLEAMNGGECEGKRLDGLADAGINWLIIGAQSKPSVYPKIAWVQEIVKAADKAGIPVFLKDNLKPLFKGIEELDWMVGWELRQELPK